MAEGRVRYSLHHLDLILGQAVEGVHQPVDVRIGDGDLLGEALLLLRGERAALVQFEHVLDQCYQLVVFLYVVGVVEVNRADGEFCDTYIGLYS